MFAGALDGATTDKIAGMTQTGIVHAMGIVGEVGKGMFDGFAGFGHSSLQTNTGLKHLLHLTVPEQGAHSLEPSPAFAVVWAKGGMNNGER